MNRVNIYDSKAFLWFILFLLLKPESFSQLEIVSKIYTYGCFACTLLLIALVIANGKPRADIVWTFLFYGTILVSTIINGGDLYQYMRNQFSGLAMCLVFILWLDRNPRLLADSFRIFDIYIYINLLTIILFPDGMYESSMYTANWFLGYKNPQVRTILPIVCLSLISTYHKYERMNASMIILMACSMLTFMLNDSATGLVGFGIFLVLFLFFHKSDKKLPKFISLLTGMLATFGGFVLIVVMNMQYMFTYFIEVVLGRSLTFTGRLNIWSKSLEMFSQHKFIGMGYLAGDEYSQIYGSLYATHPHNFFLYLLVQGGIVLFAVFLFGILFANKKLNETIDTVYSKTILFGLIAFLVMGLSESLVTTVLLYPMLILGMNADKIAAVEMESKPITVFGKVIRIKWNRNE